MSTTTVRTYKARDGGPINDQDAQRIGGFLERRFGNHAVTPVQFVEAAKPEHSPIHRDLNWDDASAAHEHRLEQARACLRAIKVTVETPRGPVTTRAYHVIRDHDEQAYVPQEIVWSDPDFSQQVIDRARGKLASLAHDWEQYQVLADLRQGVLDLLDRTAS